MGNIKAVILAGGLGSRLSEETSSRPKPMVEIGGMPILWHIMNIYAAHGVTDFVICLGYKGYMIKEYFVNHHIHSSNITVALKNGEITFHDARSKDWRVTMIDTGELTMTGGRLKRVADYLKNEDFFCMTYGDGLSDVNIKDLIAFHKKHGKLATVTAALPAGRFGALDLDQENCVQEFKEKPRGDKSYINGGFFVLSPRVFDYIDHDDSMPFEKKPLEKLAEDRQMMAFPHEGFWQPMDTLRDKNLLEELWNSGNPPWKIWQ